jgi:hypothetical protein
MPFINRIYFLLLQSRHHGAVPWSSQKEGVCSFLRLFHIFHKMFPPSSTIFMIQAKWGQKSDPHQITDVKVQNTTQFVSRVSTLVSIRGGGDTWELPF